MVLQSHRVTLRQFAAAAILAIAIGSPIVELCDSWDPTFQDGNDTEAQAVVVALCVGVVLVIGTIAVTAHIRALASSLCPEAVVARVMRFPARWLAAPIPTSSPPIPLRV
jgi:hypothetical protein